MRTSLSLSSAAAVLLGSACGEPAAPLEPAFFATVSAGDGFHTCGVAVDGRGYCWGSNNLAQLGGGPTMPLWQHPAPLPMAGEHRFTAVSAGGLHNCALDADRRASCWGSNRYGQLGIGHFGGPEGAKCGTVPCASEPTAVEGDLEFQTITAGWSHTCALSRAGDVYCWGSNSLGELGIGRSGLETSQAMPVRVASALRFTAVSAGERHTCALDENGAAFCWGQNSWAQLGPVTQETCVWEDGVTTVPCSTIPVPSAEGVAFTDVTAEGKHTCGLATDGGTYCWGYNGSAQLGADPATLHCEIFEGTSSCSRTPVRVSGDGAFNFLEAGGVHNCGLLATGEAFCWGAHLIGQLGDCSLRDWSAMPRPVCGGHRFAQLSAGGHHTCAVALDGAAYCWGGNDAGELGAGLFTAFGPVRVDPPFTP